RSHAFGIDHWSVGTLAAQLAELYDAAVAGGPAELPSLPVSYRDVAAWQHDQLASGALDAHVAWWADRLRNASPTPALPPDRRAGPDRSWQGEQVVTPVPANVGAALRRVASSHGSTLFAALVAGFDATVVRLTG